jgi:hypothetical protein
MPNIILDLSGLEKLKLLVGEGQEIRSQKEDDALSE